MFSGGLQFLRGPFPQQAIELSAGATPGWFAVAVVARAFNRAPKSGRRPRLGALDFDLRSRSTSSRIPALGHLQVADTGQRCRS